MTTTATPMPADRRASDDHARSVRPDTADRSARSGSSRRSGFSRYLSLARAEMTILLRNKVATFYAIAMAPLLVALFAVLPQVELIAAAMGGSLTVYLVAGIVIFGLAVAVYYNLTTAVVARREKLVLKRLISGESTHGQVLAAIATPNVVIMLVQVVLVVLVGSFAFGAPDFTNPLLVVLALVLGVPFFVMVSFVTGAHTRTVESAQLTTMPFIIVGMLLSGAILPVALLPDTLVTVLQFTPIYPVTELVTLGLAGSDGMGGTLSFADTFGAALRPVLVMLVWNGILWWALRATMRWEPRR